MGEMEVFLNENSEFDDRETVLDLYFKIRDFLYVSDRLDENYRIYSRLLAGWLFYGKTDVCQSFQMPAGMPGPGREYSVFFCNAAADPLL